MGLSAHELVEADKVDPSLLCSVCQGIFVDPVCGPCRHVFCRLCIQRALDTSCNGCPQCRQPLEDHALTTVPLLKEEADTVHVRCNKLCGWTGRADERCSHWFQCPVAQKHEFAVELDVQACCGIGLLLDFGANVSLIVTQILPNFVRSAGGNGQLLKVGDALVEVDGSRGDPIELGYLLKAKLFRRAESLRLIFQHPVEFTTTCTAQAGKPLGLNLKFTSGGNIVFLEGLAPDGAIMDCIKASPPGTLLPKKDDRLTSLNSTAGTPADLQQAYGSITPGNIILTFHRFL
eukprot:CAMPEP_0115060858 /NCGR_PEP_ID=MMETSP0227-20121206/7688_1 /TAXON_ID=89957 /ORGANISM="Polarella glacialis, Strain CCMP 1383" /LENGTH=289 /DNA_ID=CAMNT_0002446101 /DNA_START=79 /DNA_END=948 /DNA_ORIENTATION=-